MRKMIPIEEWIRELIGSCTAFRDMVWTLHDRLVNNRYMIGADILFIGAAKELQEVNKEIETVVISPNGTCSYTHKRVREAYACEILGDGRYVKFFEGNKNLVSAKDEAELKKVIEKAIEFYDLDANYNTVGKPVNVRIWPQGAIPSQEETQLLPDGMI